MSEYREQSRAWTEFCQRHRQIHDLRPIPFKRKMYANPLALRIFTEDEVIPALRRSLARVERMLGAVPNDETWEEGELLREDLSALIDDLTERTK